MQKVKEKCKTGHCLEDMLANAGIYSPSDKIKPGYKFQAKGKTWTVKSVNENTAICQYTSCSCSKTKFNLSDIPLND